MVGWHHRLNGHVFEQALGDGEGKRSLACCSPWGHKEWDMTEELNNKKTFATGEEDSNLGLGRYPGGGNDNPLYFSCLEDPMNRIAWRAPVDGVARVIHD